MLRNYKLKILVFIFVFSPISIHSVHGLEGKVLEATKQAPVMHYYAGNFQWQGPYESQRVEFCFTQRTNKNNEISLKGHGRYFTSKSVTEVALQGLVKLKSHDIEIWESDPVGSKNFITDGSHHGTISNDLNSINAIWATNSNKQKGKLQLQAAAPNEYCPGN